VFRTFGIHLFLLIAFGCQTKVPDPELRIDASVQPYVDRFVGEAKKRGIFLNIDNLILEFAALDADFICGQCKNPTRRQKYIVLGLDKVCWKEAREEEKECLVFHEMGHCYLARLHTSKRFANDAYVSLMNPDDTGIYAVCVYPINGNGDDCDKRTRRQYYLDELFNENTPTPAWAK
jgi:hypothetical protein